MPRPDRNPWTNGHIATLRRMREEEGASFPEISQEINHSEQSCMQMASRFGIRAPSRVRHKRRVDARATAKSAYTGRLTRAARAKSTLRPCLCCRQDFPSQGNHNRLCASCRSQDSDTVFTTPAVVLR